MTTPPRPIRQTSAPARVSAPNIESAPIMSAPTPTAPPEVTTAVNPDKVRQDELASRTTAYQSKTVTASGQTMDRPELLVLGQICTQLSDESKAVSGAQRFDGAGAGGLQQPRKP